MANNNLPEKIRVYLTEPVGAAFCLSILLNIFGEGTASDFMHTEAHDLLSLLTVLLAAALALWVGLFWITNTDFGQWLMARGVLESINAAYITAILILVTSCLALIVCAYLGSQHVRSQEVGAFICLYGLATIPTTLINTYKLLKLHGAFSRQHEKVSEITRANLR